MDESKRSNYHSIRDLKTIHFHGPSNFSLLGRLKTIQMPKSFIFKMTAQFELDSRNLSLVHIKPNV